jgi:hypothetical protein
MCLFSAWTFDMSSSREMKLVWVKEKGRSSFGLLGGYSLVLVFHEAHLRSVPTGRVIFEIGGTPIREELAREGRKSCPPLFYSNSFLHSFTPSSRQAPNNNGIHHAFDAP